MKSPLSYPLRMLRADLKMELGVLRSTEAHIRNAGRRHSQKECYCLQQRRRHNDIVAQLHRAIAILTEGA